MLSCLLYVLLLLLMYAYSYVNLRMRYGISTGYTALHCAVAARAPEAVAALLRAGADFHMGTYVDMRGMTPLHMAAAQGSKEIVLLLLKAQVGLLQVR